MQCRSCTPVLGTRDAYYIVKDTVSRTPFVDLFQSHRAALGRTLVSVGPNGLIVLVGLHSKSTISPQLAAYSTGE